LIPPLPDSVRGIELATGYFPAAIERGFGDIYDCFVVGSDMLALVIGEAHATGHGASVLVGSIKHALRQALFSMTEPSPAPTLNAMNTYIREQARERFGKSAWEVSLLLALLHLRTGHLTLASAASEPLLIRRLNGSIEPIPGTDDALGAEAHPDYRNTDTVLCPGEWLFAMTDGLPRLLAETRVLGTEETLRVLETVGGEDTAGEISGILQKQALSTYTIRNDDACWLLAHWQPPADDVTDKSPASSCGSAL
jgi:serine phosphatase RsbU (regulator of sigma subunit)